MKIVSPSVTLEFITPDACLLIERAGRTCYKSENSLYPEVTKSFIKMLLSRKHYSVLEHASATFRIVCDRGVSHELVRHRIASYSQESTRYCNYSHERFGREISVIEPPGLFDNARKRWIEACETAEEVYFDLLDSKCTPQIARSVLPTCLKTELVMTANFREWLHFLELRTSPAAHPQMRVIAEFIETILQSQCSEVFNNV